MQIYLPKYALWSSHLKHAHLPDTVPGLPRVIPGAARALHRGRQGRTPRAYRGEPPTRAGSTRPSEPLGSPRADTVWNLYSSIRNPRCSSGPLLATVSTGGRHGRGGEQLRPHGCPLRHVEMPVAALERVSRQHRVHPGTTRGEQGRPRLDDGALPAESSGDSRIQLPDVRARAGPPATTVDSRG